MKTSCKVFIFLLIIFISAANAGYNSRQLYLHPTSSIYSWSMNPFNCIWFDGEKDPCPLYVIYLTFEIPLNLSNSLIIQPSLWYNKNINKTYILDGYKLVYKLFRLGSGIGLRHYFFAKGGKDDGLYFQAMSSAHYYSIKESHNVDLKGFYADLLGYLGYSWKFSRLSIFFDIGIGTIFPTDNPSEVITAGCYNCYKDPITFDANLGIGFSF